jgi:hypothetical protein
VTARSSILGLLLSLLAEPLLAQTTPIYDRVVTSSWADLDQDGRNDSIEIVLTRGALEDWDDDTGPHHVGQFSVRVTLAGRPTVVTALNGFFSEDADRSLSFCALPWSLQLRDYDGDGRIDFNLGQWGTSNGHIYRLFAISTTGAVRALPVPHDELFVAALVNSTREIRASGGELRWASYANSCDADDPCGWFINESHWNSERLRFESSGSRHVERKPTEFLSESPRGFCG